MVVDVENDTAEFQRKSAIVCFLFGRMYLTIYTVIVCIFVELFG